MSNPLVVSFFTRDSGYEAEAREMERTARAFGFFTDVRAVPDLGDWCANCAQKPAYIRDRMREYSDRPLVWLDADARVVRRPELFDAPGCDFAAHWLRDNELISACLYFAPTAPARELLWRWQLACAGAPGVWDQKHLQGVVNHVPGLRVMRLPPEYNWIEAEPGTADLSELVYGKREPVIVQRQASRRLKNAAHR